MEWVRRFFDRVVFGFVLCKHAYSQWRYVMRNWNTEKNRKFQCDLFWEILEENSKYRSVWENEPQMRIYLRG